MKLNKNLIAAFIFISALFYSCSTQKDNIAEINNMYPWCIVAFDSLDRSPQERIMMLKALGFTKYAYDWRDRHLDEMESELQLAKENDIEIISVWLWLNAKRDSLGILSPANERIFEILKSTQLKTTLWLSFNNNFFKDLTQEQALKRAVELVKFVSTKAKQIGCDVALYNHRDWFGDPNNQIEIIEALPNESLSMVFNFHHAPQYVDNFPQIAKKIKPYLTAVNLNGMKKEGPKILSIGAGDYEKEMIKILLDEGFEGPWGMLGHIEDKDVKMILEGNLAGFKSIVSSIEQH